MKTTSLLWMLTTLISSCMYAATQEHDQAIKMPSLDILQERLTHAGFGHFDKQTKLAQQLANQERLPLGVFSTVQQCIHNYAHSNPEQAQGYLKHSDQLLEILLKDYPTILLTLKTSKLYTPSAQ